MWLVRGCAAGKGMVFGLFVLNRVYQFLCVCVFFLICRKQGPKRKDVVLNMAGILGFFRPFFVLNRVRVSKQQRHPYTQTWV